MHMHTCMHTHNTCAWTCACACACIAQHHHYIHTYPTGTPSPSPRDLHAVSRSDRFGTGHRLGIQNAPAGGPSQITDHIHTITHNTALARRTRRQTTQGRRCGGGADAQPQGETREGAGLCGDQQEDVRRDRLGAAGTRGTMWKTASASPPSGGRPRLAADHTHKEPCTKIAKAGTCSFLPISQ